jgi:hypothetical protein
LALAPTPTPIQWEGGLFLPRKKKMRLNREADHSLPSYGKVKKAWSCTSTLLRFFRACCLIKCGHEGTGVIMNDKTSFENKIVNIANICKKNFDNDKTGMSG